VRPRFISAWSAALNEGLELPAAGLAVKHGKEQAASIPAAAASEATEPSGIDARNSLRTWWDGVRAEPASV
jgi:hypothetical protein